MFAEILQLEEQFNAVVPTGKQVGLTTNAMMEAGANWAAAVWAAATKKNQPVFTDKQIDEAMQFSERAVFVCGSERSGTTLVRNLLDAHPQLSVLPSEGTYITQQENKLLALPVSKRCEYLCREWLWRLVISMHVPPYWLLGRSSTTESPYVDFANAFIAWWDIAEQRLSNKNELWPFVALQLAFASSQNKIDSLEDMQWVEKTPNNEQHLDPLLQAFPKAKIIQTIRNPIDVLRSNKPHEIESPVSRNIFIGNLKKSFEVANQQLIRKDKNHLIILYEELCENPSPITHQLASFLEVAYLPILLEPTVIGRPTKPNSSFDQGNTTGKIINTKARIQKDGLSQKDHELLSASLRKLAGPFGYNLQPIGILRKQSIEAGIFVDRVLSKIKRTVSSK